LGRIAATITLATSRTRIIVLIRLIQTSRGDHQNCIPIALLGLWLWRCLAHCAKNSKRRSFLFDAEPKLLNTVQYSMDLSQGDPERRPVLSKVEARQGVTGHNVRYVLWFGLAAVIVAFAAIYFFYFD